MSEARGSWERAAGAREGVWRWGRETGVEGEGGGSCVWGVEGGWKEDGREGGRGDLGRRDASCEVGESSGTRVERSGESEAEIW